ncbi:hemicentin-2-like [Anabas testudineus]|uniref:hemicentin-2-like n=1 Tax=Anabas testudineus TaxID=64144 RepID=UPI000E458BCE|nr:hemicentin-2-like [Anabas testudineus]
MSKRRSFVRLVVGFILTATGAQTFCPIELSPSTVVVKYGDPVSINCSTSDSLVETMGWEVSQGGTGMQSVNHLTWTLERLTEWTIEPSCFINLLPGGATEQCDKKAKVVLYTFPENISISSNSPSDGATFVLNENKTYNFSCNVKQVAPVQNLTVRWYKGDTLIYTDTFKDPNRKPVNQSSFLNFTMTRRDNGVTLRCEAHMDLEPEGPRLHVSSQEYDITVQFGPDVQCSQIEVLEGETLESKCPVEGNPTPFVTWRKDGKSTNLSIPLSRKDAGEYSVEAEGFSSIHEKVQVLVLYKPELNCSSTYTAPEYAPHNISCTVEGYPKPEIIWSKDGEEVEFPKNLTRSDAGQYVITVSNKLANVSATLEITVTYPPSQIVELEDSEVDAGSDVWLKCSSMGNPRPKYIWSYYRTDNVKEESEDGVSRLLIHDANAFNVGSYTCHASNERGQVSKTVRLTVRGAQPFCPIELNPSIVVVKYGDPVSINCSTSNSLVETMGWEAPQGGTGMKPTKHLTWTLERLTEWTIEPSCFINLLPGGPTEQCDKKAKVVLYTFPENISISSNSLFDGATFVLNENKTYNFSCNVKQVAPVQNLTVRWYKGDTLIYTDTFKDPNMKPVNQSSFLNFTMTRRDNGVTLRCEAHMDLEPEGPQLLVSSQEYDITVQFGPDVQCSQIEVLEGETLESKCPVEGNPTPFVTWRKDGKSTNLSIPLSRKDAGEYSVEAEGFSSIHEKVQVLVLYKPELNCSSTYTAPEYAPHNISCTVEGYPEPEIIWSKDGEEVEFPKNLTRSDAGQYVITVSNKLANVSATLEITVTYPPSQIVELEDSEVDAGSDVWLKCSSMGNPRPKYIWTYYRMDNVKEESEDGVSRLLIHDANAFNVGSYTCHASNERGQVSKTVRLTVRGAKPQCPIEISPNRMVVRYQSARPNATCKVTNIDSRNKIKISWWDKSGFTIGNSETWLVDTHKEWDLRPFCKAEFVGMEPCEKHLDFTLYKTPDSVSISSNVSLVMEDQLFQLRCDITNVAPARSLAVWWYQRNDTFEQRISGSIQVSGCLPEKNTNCISMIQSPVNVSSTINITLNRSYTNVQFRCEAELNLGLGGPQPPPIMISSPLNITVHSKPVINSSKIPKTMPVFRGYPEELVCEADGHPHPEIKWVYSSDKVARVSDNMLTVSEAGLYNCTATNPVGSDHYVVEVILKEDYLPLIAGFVAVTVVAISVIFLFIYSIYYKNTKMRRYSLKNPRFSNHTGNVAHNGWDTQFPMTKLS